MNREIKFRAWNSISNSMYNNVENGVSAFNEKGKFYVSLTLNQIAKDLNSVLMQFTGLKDGGGNDVYEFDFVKFRPNYTNKPTGETVGLVVFNDNQWMLRVNEYYYSISEETDEFYAYSEVVGNLYESQKFN
jgi:uncharacterized phage protein (TIGR01671 family)